MVSAQRRLCMLQSNAGSGCQHACLPHPPAQQLPHTPGLSNKLPASSQHRAGWGTQALWSHQRGDPSCAGSSPLPLPGTCSGMPQPARQGLSLVPPNRGEALSCAGPVWPQGPPLPMQAHLGEAEGHRVAVLGDPSWVHVLGHRRIHQPCSVHVHLQSVAVSKPTDLGGGRGAAGLEGTPGAAGTNVSRALSSSARPWRPRGAVLPGPAACAQAGLQPAASCGLPPAGGR